MQLRARLEPIAYAALRIATGFLLACHGVQKIFGWLTTQPPPKVFSQLWFGGLIELASGVLLMLGLGTRVTAALTAAALAIAYVKYHWAFESANYHWLPIMNNGDWPFLTCFILFLIALRGPGRFALDNRVRWQSSSSSAR